MIKILFLLIYAALYCYCVEISLFALMNDNNLDMNSYLHLLDPRTIHEYASKYLKWWWNAQNVSTMTSAKVIVALISPFLLHRVLKFLLFTILGGPFIMVRDFLGNIYLKIKPTKKYKNY